MRLYKNYFTQVFWWLLELSNLNLYVSNFQQTKDLLYLHELSVYSKLNSECVNEVVSHISQVQWQKLENYS